MRRRPVVTSRAAVESSRRRSLARFRQTRLAGQGEHRHPGEQVQGDLDDLQPDLVLRHVVEREVAQAGGAGGADAVFGAGAPAVTQLQRGDTAAARRNVSTPMRSLCSWNGCAAMSSNRSGVETAPATGADVGAVVLLTGSETPGSLALCGNRSVSPMSEMPCCLR
jgi:hypothetical protein